MSSRASCDDTEKDTKLTKKKRNYDFSSDERNLTWKMKSKVLNHSKMCLVKYFFYFENNSQTFSNKEQNK